MVVRPDAPPTVALAAPDEFKETSPDDDLTIAVAARDDVAVASAELHYMIERDQASTSPTSGSVASPLEGLGTPWLEAKPLSVSATLGLKPGDVLSYRVRVADNRPAPRGPNITWSQHISCESSSTPSRSGPARKRPSARPCVHGWREFKRRRHESPAGRSAPVPGRRNPTRPRRLG